jgi:hypothetical protein
MSEPIRDTAVTASWVARDGKRETRTVKTGDDGRAIFSGIPTGSRFQAAADSEGQHLVTAEFSVPEEGGTRLLLMVGEAAEEAMGQMAGDPHAGMAGDPHAGMAGDPHAGMASDPHAGMAGKTPVVRSGRIEARDGVPAGTVEIRVLDGEGKPLAGQKIELTGAKTGSKATDAVQAVTDQAGNARLSGIKVEEGTSYLAHVEHDGLRVGSEAFPLEARRGAAGEIRIPARTGDLSVLRIASISRMMIEPREDAVGILQNWVIENTSDKIFDPGPRGLFIPLPDGFGGVEEFPGGSKLTIKEGVGAFLHAPLPPNQSPSSMAQIRLGYVLATQGTSEFEIVQPLPFGMEGGLIMLPGDSPIRLSAPGLHGESQERDDNGNQLRLYELGGLAPGQPLHLTVHNLPTRDRTGKIVVAVLAALLVLAGVWGAWRKPARQ